MTAAARLSKLSSASDGRILEWSRMRPTAVSLDNLFRAGLPKDDGGSQRLKNAQFLHRELRLRVAQRSVELDSLPFGLSLRPQIMKVRQYYKNIFDGLDNLPPPMTIEDDIVFTNALETVVLSNHAEVISNMALGVRAFRRDLGTNGFTQEVREAIDLSLNKFFTARIGIRFLIEHHMASREHRCGYSGIIAQQCRPFEVVERAVDEVSYTARYHFGAAPKVSLIGDRNIQITYVPYHIHYIVSELLKNAMRATLEYHGEDNDLPDVKVIIARGEHDVTIKIADEGGGMHHRDVALCWTYLHSTAPPPTSSDNDDYNSLLGANNASGSGSSVGALAGYGFGLPLSRLYCQYFGGNLNLMSMEGHGTDAYVHLNRLGTDCENLPSLVLNSPSGGVSAHLEK